MIHKKQITAFTGMLALLLSSTCLWAQGVKITTASGQTAKTTLTSTEMTLLVNAGSLGAQPTTQLYTPADDNASRSQSSAAVLQNKNQVSPAYQAAVTKLANKTGKYGLNFNAVVVADLYYAHVLKNLDNLIEAGSMNLNPKSTDITEYILTKTLDYVAKLEAQAGLKPDPNYIRFVNSMREQLSGVNYVDVMQGDPVSFFAEVIYKAGLQQCISYCQDPFNEWTMTKKKSAGVFVAFLVADLLGYGNVAKQGNAIYKMLYDAYVAKKQGAQYGAYQPLVKRSGTAVPFVLYGVSFGSLAPIMILSKSSQALSYYWDDKCNCPKDDIFIWATFSAPHSFIVP
ncbi:hypothetical protein GCM10023187_35990 [Nibrella viscosa]|uniref:Uncharacterized protein n=1 Tax=Nibrella viscosa TaxID=1084524 RepID=A0ABP8KPA5_9BACT